MNVSRCFARRARFLCRCESTQPQNIPHNESPPFSQWSRVIREAEKIVGYPTSFMNLRWLLSDEVANMALHLRKLVGSDHPLLKTAKNLLYSEHNHLQPWGLVILLLSKSVKHNGESVNLATESNGVLQTQRILAELTEMIRTGHLVHKGLVNFDDPALKSETDLFGNKIGLLSGDYLLVTANGMLAKLHNQDISYLISCALRDLAEGEFYGDRDPQNLPLPGKPKPDPNVTSIKITADTTPIKTDGTLGVARNEWTVRNMLEGASLLGRGCQGTMILAGKPPDVQAGSYLFGCHLGLAWQAASELQNVASGNNDTFSLVSAPVLFALEENQDLYSKIMEGKLVAENVDYEDLRLNIFKTDAVDKTRKLCEEHAKCAMEFVDTLGSNESIDAMKKIITAL